jgi:hypothetical protein
MNDEEEEKKKDAKDGDVNPDALEAVFEEAVFIEEETVVPAVPLDDEEEEDYLDLAFKDDETHW